MKKIAAAMAITAVLILFATVSRRFSRQNYMLPEYPDGTGILAGKVTLPGGAGAPGALVITTADRITFTDREGYYSFSGIEEGVYPIVAIKEKCRSSDIARVRSQSAAVVDLSATPDRSMCGWIMIANPPDIEEESIKQYAGCTRLLLTPVGIFGNHALIDDLFVPLQGNLHLARCLAMMEISGLLIAGNLPSFSIISNLPAGHQITQVLALSNILRSTIDTLVWPETRDFQGDPVNAP